MIQRVKKPAKFCWMTVAIVIIAFAALLQLAKWALPSIHYFNDSIASYISRQLNAQVTLGHITATWPGLRPKVVVDDLSLVSNEGEPLVSIKQASMQLDIPLSLYNWTPVWRKLEATEVNVHVTQDTSGAWTIGGLKPQPGERNWRYRSPSALFLMAGDVKLESSTIIFTFHNQRQIKTEIPVISVQNNGHFHRLNAKAAIGNDTAFQFTLEGVGDPSIPDQFFAEAYLELNHFPVERLAQLFSQVAIDDVAQASVVDSQSSNSKGLSTSNSQRSEHVAESEANLKLWLDFASPSRFLMNGHIELVNDESSDFAKKYYLDIPVSADISGDYSIQTGLSVGLRDIFVDKLLSVEQAHINVHENKITTAIDTLDLKPWVTWSEKRLIRSDTVNNILSNLSPTGHLNNIISQVNLLDPSQSTLSANAFNVDTQAWNGLPSFTGASGFLDMSLDEGIVLLDANQFSFFPDVIYNEAVVTDRARGAVSWRIDTTKKQVEVYGYDLMASSEYGEARGHFALDLGWGSNKEYQNLVLQVGLQNSNALFHKQLVPKLLPRELLRWMSASIKSGDVKQAGLFYRGGFQQNSERTIQFFADLENGRLDFSDDWPALNNLKGRFIVEDKQIRGSVDTASVYNRDFFQGEFKWNKDDRNVLNINAKGSTNIQSGSRYLRESWLNTKAGPVAKQLDGKGRVGVDVKLTIPLNHSPVPATQNVSVYFKNNTVALKETGLTFEDVSGTLHYSTERGFASNHLSGKLFGQSVIAEVGLDASQKDKIVLIKGSGNAPAKSIANWLQHPILNYLSGNADYHLAIQIPLEESLFQPNITVTSNLVGVSVAMPAPFDKRSEAVLPLTFTMPLNENKFEYKLVIGNIFSGHFLFEQDDSYRAIVAVSDKQYPQQISLPESGVKLVSQFNDVDGKAWLDFLKQYPRDENKLNHQTFNALFSIDHLRYNDSEFDNLMVSGHREQNGWSLLVEGDDILGGVYVDDNKERPLIVDIDYLNWPPGYVEQVGKTLTPEPTDVTSSIDILADVNPAELPAANIKINRLIYKNKPLGSWMMQLQPDSEGLWVRNLVATVNGFTLAGEGDNQGASLRWFAGGEGAPMSTVFNGKITGGNPKTLFEQWDLPFGLESEQTLLTADLSWLGSPAGFDIAKLQGNIRSEHKKGIFTQEKTNEATGILRLFGLFNFDSWARRIRLDFSDVYKKGIVFDDLHGQLTFDRGLIVISEPVTMQGPSSKMSLSGSIDYPEKMVDAHLVATIPIGGNLAVVAGIAGGLPAAAGVYLVSKLFEKQVEKVSSVNYSIDGHWNNPVIKVENLKEQATDTPSETAKTNSFEDG